MRLRFTMPFFLLVLSFFILWNYKEQDSKYYRNRIEFMSIEADINVVRGEYLRKVYEDLLKRCAPLCMDQVRESQGYGKTPYIKAYGGMGMGGHPGVDYVADTGTSIRAAHDGEVFEANGDLTYEFTGYGNRVKLRKRKGNSGYETVYAHMQDVYVKVGDKVKYGDVIGTVGNSGFSTAPHLHFGVRHLYFCDDKQQINHPCEVINGENGMYGWVDPRKEDWYALRHE